MLLRLAAPSPHPKKLKRLSPIFSWRVFGRRTPVERAENNFTIASASRLAIGHRSRDCQPREPTWWSPASLPLPFPQLHLQGAIHHHSIAQVGDECFPAIFGDIGRMGRTWPTRCGFKWSLPLATSAANANLKASSRARPSGVRHPLTSLPFFHLRSDLLRLFFLETVLPRANDSAGQTRPETRMRLMNRHETARSAAAAAPSIHHCKLPHTCLSTRWSPLYSRCIKPLHPFSHKFRDFRVAFSHLALISRASCQCSTITHACASSRFNSVVRQINARESKASSPSSF